LNAEFDFFHYAEEVSINWSKFWQLQKLLIGTMKAVVSGQLQASWV
jgi:hypothetical protein